MAKRRSRRPGRSAEERLVAGVVGQLSRTREGRRVLIVLFALAVLAFAGYWAWQRYQEHVRPRHPVGPTVRVATWNLRKFSDRPGTDLRAIADVIRSSNFDLVAVQEVMKEGEMVDALLNELGTPWRAARISDRTGNFERFAFVYNGDHVQEVGGGAYFITPLPRVNVAEFQRKPYQCGFRAGQFDFTVVSVHLSYEDTARRKREARELAEYAEGLARTSAEKDVIVLGDFNAESANDLLPFDAAGWRSLNHEPTNLGSTEVYDTLLIDPGPTREWDGTGGAVRFDEIMPQYADDRIARQKISDHRPAYADFVTNLPDDD